MNCGLPLVRAARGFLSLSLIGVCDHLQNKTPVPLHYTL